jgi:sugar phosphate isomerase/epimerase
MRFGCCPGLASFVPPTLEGQEDSLSVAHAKQCARIPAILDLLEAAGFDYVEFGVGTAAPEQPEEDFGRFLGALEGSALRAEVFSSFIPPWIKVVGPEADWARIGEYLTVAVARVARAGADRIIFGSGGARTCPEGFEPSEAREQLRRFLILAGDRCARHGVVLCIEPLNATETNLVNTVAEGMEAEPFDSIVKAGDLLKHAHVADKGRRYPAAFGYDIDGFLAALRAAGYDDRVSIEANFADLATEAPAGLQRIRQAAG